MATWDGGSGSPRKPTPPFSPNVKQIHSPQDTLQPDTEENVVEQTEDVFKNFLYQSYRIEKTKEEFDSTPAVPELTNFTADPLSPAAQVGRQLAKIGDDINQKYSNEFDQMIRDLNIDQSTAYEAFAGVARKLVSAGPLNWGRILSLFSFGFRIAMQVLRLGERIREFGNALNNIISYVVRFITDTAEGISRWIASQGGWQAAMSYVPNTSNYYMMGVVLTALSAIGVVWYLKSGS